MSSKRSFDRYLQAGDKFKEINVCRNKTNADGYYYYYDKNMKPYLKTGPQLTIIFTIDPSADYFLN